MTSKIVRWHIFFSGRVQFVGFRYTALLFARQLDLAGWVRNLPDGRVEMEVQGPPSRIRKLILLLKARPKIQVTHTEIQEVNVLKGAAGFHVSDQYLS